MHLTVHLPRDSFTSRKRFLFRMVLETPKGIEFDATNKKVYEQREIIGLAERQCSTSSKKYPVN